MENDEVLELTGVVELSEEPKETRESDVINALRSLKSDYISARTGRDEVARIAYILYADSLKAYQTVKEASGQVVGNVKTDWRHTTHGPFCFENVETVVGYLMEATFPNKDYFVLEPTKKEDLFRAKVATALVQKKLSQAKVKSVWEAAYRQAAIIGYSVISMNWLRREGVRNFRVEEEESYVDHNGEIQKRTIYQPTSEPYLEYDNLELRCENPGSVYLDPTGNTDSMIKVVPMSLADILGFMASGYFNTYSLREIESVQSDEMEGSLNDATLKAAQGNASASMSKKDLLNVYEFWGDFKVGERFLKNHHVVFMGNLLLKCEEIQGWQGKPYVTVVYTRMQDSPYGYGIIEPALSYYLLLDIIQNQRLDVFELALNGGIIKLKSTSNLSKEDVVVEPGMVLEVNDPDDITMLELPLDNVRVAKEDIQMLIEQIKRSSGAADYVAAGPGRSGERVTKEEITSVRNAGGNRLRLVRDSIETNSFLPFLEKAYRYYTQNISTQETLRILGQSSLGRMARQLKAANEDVDLIEPGGTDTDPPEYIFIPAGPRELAGIFEVEARGSDYIVNRGEKFSELSTTAQMIFQVPALSAHLDPFEFLQVLYEHSGTDGYERFIKRYAGVEQEKTVMAMLQPTPTPPGIGGEQPVEAPGGAAMPTSNTPGSFQGLAAGGGLEQVLAQLSGQNAPVAPEAV